MQVSRNEQTVEEDMRDQLCDQTLDTTEGIGPPDLNKK